MSSKDRKYLIDKLNQFEFQFISSNFTNNDFNLDEEYNISSDEYELLTELKAITSHIVCHDYVSILQKDYACLQPFKEVCRDFTLAFFETYNRTRTNYQYLFHPDGEKCSYIKQLILLLVGASALQEFVKINVCDPSSTNDSKYKICSNFFPDSLFSDELIIDAFSRDGEVILAPIIQPKLLFLSFFFLHGNTFSDCLTHKWWLLRCMVMHQKVLSGIVIELHESIISLIEHQKYVFLNNKSEHLAELLFNVECAQTHLYYNEVNITEKYLQAAQNILGIGIMFPKEKYKIKHFDKFIPFDESFHVIVKRNDKRYTSQVIPNLTDFPENLFIADVLYCQVDVFDADNNKIYALYPEEELVLLAYCDMLNKFKRHEVYELPLVYYLSTRSDIWAIQIKSLMLECQKLSKETSSKSLHQMQVLEEYLKGNNPFPVREKFLYAAALPLNWEFQELYAMVLCASRDRSKALLLCEKYCLWQYAVRCYEDMNLIERGMRVFEVQISLKPSSALWCFFGDLCKKPKVYEVAWELSQYKNMRSMYHLAQHYYDQGKFSECLSIYKMNLFRSECFQPKVLYMFADAAETCEEYEYAVMLHRKIINLDKYNYHAWHKLTYIYIKINNDVEASQCLLKAQFYGPESLTYDHYILLSARIGAFSDSIKAFQNYINKSGSVIHFLSDFNFETLRLLVDAIVNNVPDCRGKPSANLMKRMEHLFKTITASGLQHSTVFELYSNLLNTNVRGGNRRLVAKALYLKRKVLRFNLASMGDSDKRLESLLQSVLKVTLQSENYVKNLPIRYIHLKNKEVRLSKEFLHGVIITIQDSTVTLSDKANATLQAIQVKLERMRTCDFA